MIIPDERSYGFLDGLRRSLFHPVHRTLTNDLSTEPHLTRPGRDALAVNVAVVVPGVRIFGAFAGRHRTNNAEALENYQIIKPFFLRAHSREIAVPGKRLPGRFRTTRFPALDIADDAPLLREQGAGREWHSRNGRRGHSCDAIGLSHDLLNWGQLGSLEAASRRRRASRDSFLALFGTVGHAHVITQQISTTADSETDKDDQRNHCRPED